MISSKLELNADYKLKYMLPFFQLVYKYYFARYDKFPSDSFFWSFQKNDLGISPLLHSCYMLHPLHCPYYVLENEIEFFISYLTRMSVQEILKIKEWKKKRKLFINNKADDQNGVYYNYGNSFLVSKELYFMTV